jgi:hypothetical protein
VHNVHLVEEDYHVCVLQELVRDYRGPELESIGLDEEESQSFPQNTGINPEETLTRRLTAGSSAKV